ncbi:Dedicator of cytokinesis protein 3 [Grifola frondosa]|uniref:Dedicator of cytokinesis protein 3 n=1 Tax=Grifola frondosa TaxID=5627 RepID=A0A1C7LQY0_GRIFR|nr:Dedicator of cytokinesis protein 3 [Grifola frondosa]
MVSNRKGVWEPLPLIVYGYAIHPLSPNRRDTKLSNRTRLSTFTDASGDEHLVHRDVVSLEVGDNVYAFEKYTPRDKEVEGIWYRGYVVCTSRRPQVNWALSSDPSSSSQKPTAKADETQQVFIGIFPASHIHVREELSDAEGRLAELANSLNGGASVGPSGGPSGGANGSTTELYSQWNRDRSFGGMDTLREDDEDRKSFKLTPPPDQANSARARLPVYPASLRSASPTESQVLKPLPPRPSLKSGDDTQSGAMQPIIDEIASALREWHALIAGTHRGAASRAAATARADAELGGDDVSAARVRGAAGEWEPGAGFGRDRAAPELGGLVTVDVEGEIDTRSWVSAVRMYAMQASLAYMDVSPKQPQAYKLPPLNTAFDVPSQANSAFPEYARSRGHSRSLGSLSPTSPTQPRAKFYHVFLDLRAFVASPCAPGETVELFFSLYNKTDARFVSEDFCAVLNHNGVLARDPSSRIRTLFTDLVQADAQEPIFLVCRIVRNGAMKMGSYMGSILEGSRRASEASANTYVDSAMSNDTYVHGRGSLGSDSPQHFRRPFGCAVLELTQLRAMAAEQTEVSSTREHTMPIFVPTNETTFSMIHQDILNHNTREYEKSPRAEMMAVSIKVFYGDADTVVRENTSLLQDTPLSLRLGFADVVFPGDVRNELYVKLWSGDFTASQSTTARRSVANFARGQVGSVAGNVQVTMEVRDKDGRTIDRVISQCSGEPETTYFNSLVFQRTSQPHFGELVKLKLPFEGAQQWHLFFTFRLRSARERSTARGMDAAERPFAFAYLPLFPDGRAFLEDGSHTLVLYRADRLGQITADMYLGATPWLPANQRPEQVYVPLELQKIAPPMRDGLVIRSSLCSTIFTQNSVLLSLLNWEKITDKALLSTILTKFTFVGEVEIVKFLRDIFDSLFAILVSQNNQSGEMDHLVFNALVTVLGIVQDRRFSNFQPVLDVYIEKHFNCASASSHMIHSMNRLQQDPSLPETASALRAALKVWHYLFKFIARSRELQKAKAIGMGGGATADHLESSFKRELRNHLSEVNRMMSTTSPPSIIGTQTIALQHFTSILPELSKVFSTVELVAIATAFANAIVASKGKIVIWKLIMHLQIVKGFLFDNPKSRSLLVEAVVIWIKPQFGRFDEYTHIQPGDSDVARDTARVGWLECIRLSVTVIAVMLDKLQQSLVQPEIISERNLLRQEQYNIEYLLSLLPKLLDSYEEYQNPASQRAVEHVHSSSAITPSVAVTFPESYPFSLVAHLPKTNPASSASLDVKAEFNPGLGETAIVLLVMILSSPKKQLINFLENILEIEGRDRLASLLLQFFKVAASILDNDAFPKNWLNVNILAHKVLLKMMDPVATLIEREFVPDEHAGRKFDANLWRECFYVLLKLLSSEHLVIEEFSPQKRRAVWRLAGDIRGEGAALLLRVWDALGWPEEPNDSSPTRYENYQTALNSLVGHVVNLCLSHHDQLRYNAVHVLYCMIISEYHVSGHFEHIENELVSKLDTLFMSDSKGDDISRAFFISNLRHLFDSSEVDEQLRERVTGFLDSVDQFLELLLSVRALPEGEEFSDDRVIATLRLMNFIRRIGRDEIYIKYVHQLVNMHLQSQNYVEAALTLKLHADLHEWDLNSFAPPMEDLGLPQQSSFHRKETLCLLILDYLGKCSAIFGMHLPASFNARRYREGQSLGKRLRNLQGSSLPTRGSHLQLVLRDSRRFCDIRLLSLNTSLPINVTTPTTSKLPSTAISQWQYGTSTSSIVDMNGRNSEPSVNECLTNILASNFSKRWVTLLFDVRFGNDQYIQCTAVTPEPNRDLPIFTNPDVPPQIRAYYEHSAINLFSYSRPITRTRDGTEEIWIEKTYLTTEEAFPTVLRRSEIIDAQIIQISPVETALHEVQQRTRELAGLNLKYLALAKTAQNVSTNALAMSLNAAVDAPLNSGVGAFRQVFLSDDYVLRHPERAEQVRIIHSCLRLHEQLCPPEMLSFHATLEKFFRKNFQDEISRLAVDTASDFRSVESVPSSARINPLAAMPSPSYSALRQPLAVGPLQVHNLVTSPSPLSPRSQSENGPYGGEAHWTKQTPLQRHLAHLARHGFNGVSSGPGDNGGSDSFSEESPRNSFVNGSGGAPIANLSGAASMNMSTIGSIGSIKGRFSKFGSLNFGR